MARGQAITEISKKPNPGTDPTGREVIARQWSPQKVTPPSSIDQGRAEAISASATAKRGLRDAFLPIDARSLPSG
jgi:hypothetical protein